MIIFLYGEDTYRSRQKLNEIVEHYKGVHKSGLNLRYFDFQKDDFIDFKDSFRSFSMFDEKKLIVIRNSFSNPAIEDNFKDILKNLVKSKDIIVFYEEKINKKKPLFKSFKKYAKSQEFFPLSGKKLENWVRKEFEKYSAKIDKDALDLLLNFVRGNTWQLSNEIKKLVSYKSKPVSAKVSAGAGKIKKEDVKALVKPKIETDIFETIDAIASQDKKRALSLIQNHLKKGDSPSYILAMINFQFRNLLIIRDLIERRKFLNQILKEVNLHPFVVKKSFFQAKKFEFDELKKIYQELSQIDLKIKTGKIDPENALNLLIAQI